MNIIFILIAAVCSLTAGSVVSATEPVDTTTTTTLPPATRGTQIPIGPQDTGRCIGGLTEIGFIPCDEHGVYDGSATDPRVVAGDPSATTVVAVGEPPVPSTPGALPVTGAGRKTVMSLIAVTLIMAGWGMRRSARRTTS